MVAAGGPGEAGDLEELKHSLIQNLESAGVLSGIRAQIRACVFEAIDRQTGGGCAATAQKLCGRRNGPLCAEVIAEFFEFHGLRHTLAVFRAEAALAAVTAGQEEHTQKPWRLRCDVATDAGLRSSAEDESSLLEQLLDANKLGSSAPMEADPFPRCAGDPDHQAWATGEPAPDLEATAAAAEAQAPSEEPGEPAADWEAPAAAAEARAPAGEPEEPAAARQSPAAVAEAPGEPEDPAADREAPAAAAEEPCAEARQAARQAAREARRPPELQELGHEAGEAADPRPAATGHAAATPAAAEAAEAAEAVEEVFELATAAVGVPVSCGALLPESPAGTSQAAEEVPDDLAAAAVGLPAGCGALLPESPAGTSQASTGLAASTTPQGLGSIGALGDSYSHGDGSLSELGAALDAALAPAGGARPAEECLFGA